MYHSYWRNLILIVFPMAMVVACSSGEQDQTADLSTGTNSLEGSWELSKYINHPEGGVEWESYGPEIMYQKHITPTHFTWFKYNKETDILEGAGGGTYKFNGLVYTENIHFYHPAGTSLLGQAIPFDANFENGLWFHTGYSKELEFDPEVGELIIVDTTKIEEQWLKMGGVSNTEEMVKTWNLVGHKFSPSDSTYAEYPDFVKYIKLLTPTHFTWIKYNNEEEGGEVLGLGSGRYESADSYYKEFIDVIHPSGSNMINTKITFEKALSDNQWLHLGYILRVKSTRGEIQVLDSALIDEIWQ
ncbi:MAG: hypothetical protein HKN68_04320 [Saprospiraceae bacterium]|nr:hypothetical protein [Saprospiraceae bacterium]